MISCRGGSTEENTPNNLVIATTLLTPSDNQVCTELPVALSWQSVPNATSYRLTVNKMENGTESLVSTFSTANTTYSLNNLEKGKLYKWKIETIGTQNSKISNVFQFQTESTAVINHAPFAPELVSPLMGSVISNNTVSWKCTEPDNEALTYDVYLGISAESTVLKKSGLTNTSFQFTGLSANTIYYWKIVAKDTHSNFSIGQVWYFITP